MLPELEDCHLDHIAIAVKDIESAVKKYTDIGLFHKMPKAILCFKTLCRGF